MSTSAPTTPLEPRAIEAQLTRVLAELQTIREILAGTRKPLLTVSEVARLVGRDEYTVRRWISERKLRASRVSGTGPKGRLLVKRDDLDELIATGRATERPGNDHPTP